MKACGEGLTSEEDIPQTNSMADFLSADILGERFENVLLCSQTKTFCKQKLKTFLLCSQTLQLRVDVGEEAPVQSVQEEEIRSAQRFG